MANGARELRIIRNDILRERLSRLVMLGGLSVLLLTCGFGCNVGPDYGGVESPPLPAAYLNACSDQKQLTSPISWATLDDGYLNQLIVRGMENSPSVEELSWRIQEASHNIAIVSGQAEPFVDSVDAIEARKNSSNGLPFVQSNSDSYGFFSLGLNSRWEIDLVGRIRKETQAATFEYEGTIEDLMDLRRILAGNIARAYVQLRMNQELVEQVKFICAKQESSLREVEARMQAGQVTRLDLVQLRSRLELNRSLLPVYEQGIRQNYHALALLTGITPSENDCELLVSRTQLDPPNFCQEIPANQLRRRPDVRREERAVAAACVRIGVAEAEFYPRLNILGTIAFNSRNLTSLIELDSLTYGIGPGITWNILSMGRIESQVEVQTCQLQQAIAGYQQTVLQSITEVEDALAAQHPPTSPGLTCFAPACKTLSKQPNFPVNNTRPIKYH